ncbi:MAG: nucleotidyltransferase domain-containing protein [Bacteroidota bacterium]|nr:nucleotidyltransferase domain-containing protein [Bacteroidota bacterium]
MNKRSNNQNIEWILERIKEIVAKHLNVDYQLILFGSRVRDDFHARSDIDAGIISDSPIKSGIMVTIRDDLDQIPTLLKIDLVDFNTISKGVRQIALQHFQELTI